MYTNVGNFLSAESYIRKQLSEAQSYSHWHCDVTQMYAEMAERAGREDLFPLLQGKFDSIWEEVQVLNAGKRHLAVIESLRNHDKLEN